MNERYSSRGTKKKTVNGDPLTEGICRQFEGRQNGLSSDSPKDSMLISKCQQMALASMFLTESILRFAVLLVFAISLFYII